MEPYFFHPQAPPPEVDWLTTVGGILMLCLFLAAVYLGFRLA